MGLMTKEIYFVHAIDTEGPLYESLEAKFERIKNIYNIDIKDKTEENLIRIKNKEINLKGKETEVSQMLSSHLTNYKDNWSKIDNMNEILFSDDFRNEFTDTSNKPWIFSWHCLDHVGYINNPRKRELGHHKIFDYYQNLLNKKKNYGDKIFWHFHPMSMFRDAHKCATSYVNSFHLYEILCRKIIERDFFPSCFRAGFQAERTDSNLFLEQWIPFDITNMSYEDNQHLENTIDFKNGRSGDWRRATKNWEIYNPSHDDYQIKGNCRRYIGRALNVLNRIASINDFEIEKAFKQANQGKPALVGFASHDFRDFSYEVNYLRNMIKNVAKNYPDVKFFYKDTNSAFNQMIIGKDQSKLNPIKLKLEYFNDKNDVPRIVVKCIQGKTFGPQPFLAIERKDGTFVHDNFDHDLNPHVWHYAFHDDTLPIEKVKRIGIASNDIYGNTDLVKFDFN
jgi:hypothetical protein